MNTLQKIATFIVATFMAASIHFFCSCNNTPAPTLLHQTNTVSIEECQDPYIKTIGVYQFTALGSACYEGNLTEVKSLVAKGTCKKRCLTDDIYEYDALYTSVLFNQRNIVEYFIKTEEVNRIYDENGMTLLSLACTNNHTEIARLLLQAGAEVNGGGFTGGDLIIYPLFEAVKNNNLKLVQLLVENKADITVMDIQGETVFSIMDEMKKVDMEMKEYLIRIEGLKD
jgi:ankyrin repeat protein